jgi:mannose-6-phosphate isomerase-like protein (cupin superfamily)
VATIILEEAEAFEHRHEGPSHTFLIEGEAELEMLGETLTLQRDRPVEVPAGVSHTIRNSGRGQASVGCAH